MIDYNSVSKTVYSLVWPETQNLMLKTLQEHALEMVMRHSCPHNKLQDAIGPDFAQSWWKWANVSDEPSSIWSSFYPTNGASEALREIINELMETKGTLFVFEGEYEGYQAIAQGHGIPVVQLSRQDFKEQWHNIQDQITRKSQFWISQPSSIDGCYWEGFDDWCNIEHPLLEKWVDLTYIGATPSSFARKFPHLSPSHITGCIFSLSKPAGMYYRRIGGCFSSRPIAGLYGNMWFKNIDSIYLGQAFIDNIELCSIPDKYVKLQHKIIKHFNQDNEPHALWMPSHVVLLAYANRCPLLEKNSKDPKRFQRGSSFRVCLTPQLHQLIVGFQHE